MFQMAPQVLHRVVFGTTTPQSAQTARLVIKPAILAKYVRHRVSECDYPAIVASNDETACVRGTYVSGLTKQEIWRLDVFEGDQYDRIKVRPRLLRPDDTEGDEVEAETYVWIDHETSLEEGEWDFDEFRKQKMGRWIGSSQEYEGELRPSIKGTYSCLRSK